MDVKPLGLVWFEQGNGLLVVKGEHEILAKGKMGHLGFLYKPILTLRRALPESWKPSGT